jgi:hypothetical protein
MPAADELPLQAREWWVAAATLLCVFAAFQLHLGDVIISDMDEGTYVYAGELIARGQVPYRDFLLSHPPLIALFAAAGELAGAKLVALRIVYLLIVLAAALPLYALVRRAGARQAAALLSVVTYTTGMLVLANMGRTVRLEPMMNVFLIGAVGCRFLRANSRAWSVVMGALIAGALLVKLVAVVPVAMLALADLLWERPWQAWLRRWLWAALGLALIAVPAALACLAQPHFVRDVILGQTGRPRLDLGLRLYYLRQNVIRFPPVGLGLAAAAYFVVRGRDASARSIGLLALGATLVLLVAFKTFFNYYIVQTLPWIAACFGLATDALLARWLPAWRDKLAYAAVVLLGLAAPPAYAEYYQRSGHAHVAGPRQIVDKLHASAGCVYTMYPAFALWSGRPVCSWYYQADSLVPRINSWIGDQDFLELFARSGALVLYAGELDQYPHAEQYVRAHFNRAYEDTDWTLWLRAR